MLSNLIDSLHALVQAFKAEGGQAMVEYGLILALVSVAAIAVLGVTGIGGAVVNTFTTVANAL